MNQKANEKESKELAEFREILNSFNSNDFRGRTDFAALSAFEKLKWLSELNYFRYLAQKNKM